MEFTKEQLIEQAKKNIEVLRGAAERIPGASDAAVIHLKLAEIALASLEAEPVPGLFIKCTNIEPRPGEVTIAQATPMANGEYHDSCFHLYAAPPAPEAEPVAWRYRHHNGLAPSNWRFVDSEGECNKAPNYQRQALYTTPPTPVVPDESAIELLATDLMKRIDKITGERHSVATLSTLRVSIAEACRAAMLQSFGNSEQLNFPVIPDGWVACSERMPETDGNYWGWWSESKRQGPVWFIKSELHEQFQSSEITHWMPLPAAPRQEVK